MSYMQDIDRWLDALLAVLPDEQRAGAKQQIKTKLLESYHNGQAAGEPRPAPMRRSEPPQPPVERRDNRRPFRRSSRYGR
jgi:hypothetical protein